MIYAIQAVGSEFIKFGRATSVGKRLKELETGCPFDLHILAVADWPNGAEKAIHRLLEPSHQKGEWFKDGDLARKIVGWMLAGQVDKLHEEARRLLNRSWWTPKEQREIETAERAFPSRAHVVRRAQREAWWKANGRVLTQQYDSGAPQHRPVIAASPVDRKP